MRQMVRQLHQASDQPHHHERIRCPSTPFFPPLRRHPYDCDDTCQGVVPIRNCCRRNDNRSDSDKERQNSNSTRDGHGAGGCKSSDYQQSDARVKGLSADDVIDEPVHRHRHSRMDKSGRAEDADHSNSDPENIEQDIGSILFDHCTP